MMRAYWRARTIFPVVAPSVSSRTNHSQAVLKLRTLKLRLARDSLNTDQVFSQFDFLRL